MSAGYRILNFILTLYRLYMCCTIHVLYCILYSFRNGSWSWASGRDNLEVYLGMAEKHRNDQDQVQHSPLPDGRNFGNLALKGHLKNNGPTLPSFLSTSGRSLMNSLFFRYI